MTDLTGANLSSMQPGDAAVALRSFHRRFRDAARTAVVDLDGEPDEARIDEMAARVGPDGYSAIDLVRTAEEHIEATSRAIEAGLVQDDATTAAAVTSRPDVRPGEASSGLDAAVGRVAAVAERLAERVEGADARRWETPIQVDDGSATTPLALLRELVAALVTWERDLTRTLRAVRGRPGR